MLKGLARNPVAMRLLAFGFLIVGAAFREAKIQLCFVDIAPFIITGMLLATAQMVKNQKEKPTDK